MSTTKIPVDFLKIRGGAKVSTMSPESLEPDHRVLGDCGASLVFTVPTDLPAALSPNARGSWQPRHRATQVARALGRAYAREAVYGRIAEFATIGRLRIDATIYWAKGRKSVDDDNGWTMLKPVRDGIADALGRNDKDFTLGELTQLRDKAGWGYVVLTLTEIAP